MRYIIHPCLQKDMIEARGYQLEALKAALANPILLVLPTGLGKTAVEWMIMAEYIRKGECVILVAPTNPLVDQHYRMAVEMLKVKEGVESIVRISGSTPWQRRQEEIENVKLIISTPQVIRNDAMRGSLNLNDYSLIVFDEAHHSTGKHAMAQLADLYREKGINGWVLGATASPGFKEETVSEVCTRLGLDSIHARKSNDPMIIPYTVGMDITELRLTIPDILKDMSKPIIEHLEQEVDKLRRMGFFVHKGPISMKALRDSQKRISVAIQRGNSLGYNAAKNNADCHRLLNLLGLLLAQGCEPAKRYIERTLQQSPDSKSKQSRFLSLNCVKQLHEKLRETDELHPKMQNVKNLVTEQLKRDENSRVIVFANYRDTVDVIEKHLSEIKIVNVERFIGQTKRGDSIGMTQKEQVERLEKFKEGVYNVLICTSVGEEGLDVPSADMVIFYEPVASEIRTIQRRGRTARKREGRVYVLIAEGTRDEGVRHASNAKEKRMHKILDKIQRWLPPPKRSGEKIPVLDFFEVYDGNQKIKANEFIAEERERLTPQIELLSQQTLVDEEGRKKDITGSTIITDSTSILRPEHLRPKAQSSIMDYFDSNDVIEDVQGSEEWNSPTLDGTKSNKKIKFKTNNYSIEDSDE